MINLDNLLEIKKLDSQNMLGSLESLYAQIEEVKKVSDELRLPASYRQAKRILVMGMGGSALGAHIIKSLAFANLKLPLEIVNGYHIPAYVDKNTLVICSSYSGSTEEVLNAAQEARKKKAKIMVICSGGQLGAWATKNKVPALIFSTNNNPCGSPRMGLGYSIFGQLIMLDRCGLVKFGAAEIKMVLQIVKKYQNKFGASVAIENNLAKNLAQKLLGKSVWYVGAEHLSGSVHVSANQMNENAKRFSGYFLIPELNHHLLEGMVYPESNRADLVFVLIGSNLYDAKVQKRFDITLKMLNKNNIQTIDYPCEEKSKLEQVVEILVLGSYVSYYSALLQGIDPTAIPFVDYFKEQLKK